MKTLLIQQGCGNIYREMLRITAARHREYASRHDMDLWTISGPLQNDRARVWDKTMAIRHALSLGHYELIVWLDADTIIVDAAVDLREACSEFDQIGMTVHKSGWERHRELGWHYNAGAIFIRPSLAVIQAFDKIHAGGILDQEDQSSIMDLYAECPGIYREIAYRWNAFAVAPSDDAVVLAWHGFQGDRVAAMTEALAKL